MSKSNGSVSRRSFMAGAGVAAVGVAVAGPVVQRTIFGGEEIVPTGVWASARAHVDAIRGMYAIEIERLALALEPRFRSGELRAARDSDDYSDDSGRAADWRDNPQGKVETAAAEHFGLIVARGQIERGGYPLPTFDGDEEAARLVLLASPHADVTDESGGWSHPCYHAETAAGWDLLALARSRGWYTAPEDETPDPLAEVVS